MKFLKTFENFNDFGRFSDEDQKIINTPQEEEDVNKDDDEIKDEEDEDFIEDEIVESKKMNAGFKAYLDKQKKKKADKADKSDDKDSDKEDKEKSEKKEKSGLTAKQKKLPEALQKSILKKKK